MNYTDELLKIAGNPTPIDPPADVAWKRFESHLPYPLPSDYKEMISRFGAGWFGHFFEFLNAQQDSLENIIEDHEALRAGMMDPVPFFPDKKGVLVVGSMDRHCLCLKPANKNWITTYYHHSYQEFTDLPHSIPEFWYKLYKKELGPAWEGLRVGIWETDNQFPFFSPRLRT